MTPAKLAMTSPPPLRWFTFAAGIGFLHLSGPKPSARGAAQRERFLDIMLTR